METLRCLGFCLNLINMKCIQKSCLTGVSTRGQVLSEQRTRLPLCSRQPQTKPLIRAEHKNLWNLWQTWFWLELSTWLCLVSWLFHYVMKTSNGNQTAGTTSLLFMSRLPGFVWTPSKAWILSQSTVHSLSPNNLWQNTSLSSRRALLFSVKCTGKVLRWVCSSVKNDNRSFTLFAAPLCALWLV